ncbi:Spy/CpxP family protein refolding chaperone [Piscinibacter sp. HJYY11]|uniref:Spy/CpxP family protein refolding chaperone n=1 Tax=Piscinibacter sp. HJYY11 TaxID=2801333 RepID=UPI001920117A|nr:Spy/CpxP family protein refolding chaperone [Piscinibacter sp. HJYY11]MBL0727772.1 Spy/CpxP family protein refolding chaperone [Piscinibacter sp. HJYY11]
MLQGKAEAGMAVATGTRGLKLVMLVTLLALGGTVALSAWAQPAGSQDAPARHGAPHHGAHGHHGPRGGDFGFGGRGLFLAPPEHAERAERAVDRFLKGVDATDAQRSQIQQIVRTAAADLKPVHATVRGLREQMQQLFTAPVVDARAVEATRVQLVQQHDQASKRISQAMLDISAVLSPEQRARLAAKVKERQERMKERLQNRTLERRGAASAPAR